MKNKVEIIWAVLMAIFAILLVWMWAKPPMLGAGQPITMQQIDSQVNTMKSQQANNLLINGKYSRMDTVTIKNATFRADEYLMPSGDKGYWVTIDLASGTEMWEKSVAVGPLTVLGYDWKIVGTATATK